VRRKPPAKKPEQKPEAAAAPAPSAEQGEKTEG
jgi:hypothetical protein